MRGSARVLTSLRLLFLLLLQLVGRGDGYATPVVPWSVDREKVDRSFIAAFEHHPLRQVLQLDYLEFLRNKLVVLVGDSLTRYQYLILAKFLSSGSWVEDPGLPRSVVEKEFGSWPAFFHFTHLPLACHEVLDAYRPDRNELTHENRYFHHVGLNFTLLTFYFTPPHSLKLGRPIPTVEELRNLCKDQGASLQALRNDYTNASVHRAYMQVTDFLTHEVRPLSPDLLLLNQGYWPAAVLRTRSNVEYLATIMKASAQRAAWKVSTSARGGRAPDTAALLDELEAEGLGIFDAYSLTKDISMVTSATWDNMHFYPFVYRELNLGLVEFMKRTLAEAPGATAATATDADAASAAAASSTSAAATATAAAPASVPSAGATSAALQGDDDTKVAVELLSKAL